MAEVVKGKWYPAPPPALPDESDVDYTNRVLGLQGNECPYDHARNRRCSIGYHRECSDRHAGTGADYSGDCQCPCHFDAFTPLPDSELFDAVGILIDLYDLPRATAWRVLELVDRECTGEELTSVAHVARLLSREYDSEVTEGFAVDVAHLLANKGSGAARAFWKRIYDRRGEPEPTLGDVVRDLLVKGLAESLTADLDRAAESFVFPPTDTKRVTELLVRQAKGLFDQSPPTVEVIHEGRSVYSVTVPVRDFLGLPDTVAQTPPPALWRLRGGRATPVQAKPLSSLLGMPVKLDASMPPGGWKFTPPEKVVAPPVPPWPRIKVPGAEPLSEVLARDEVKDWGWPAPDGERDPFKFDAWLTKQGWFTRGITLIDQMRTQCAPSMMAGLSWRVPPRLFPRPSHGGQVLLFGIPVRVDDSLPVDGIPYLAFDLEES